MLKRIVSALIGLPIILFFIMKGGIYLNIFVLLLSFVGLYEFYKAMRSVKQQPIAVIGYLAAAALVLVPLINKDIEILGVTLTAALLAAFSYEIVTVKYGFNGVIATLAGILYIPFLLNHIVYIDVLKNSTVLIWLPFLTAWFTDTFAYFVGKSLGKRKFAPKVSPNKTIEGAIGGIAGSILLTTVTGLLINRLGYQIPLIHFTIIGFICSIASQFGDLAASYIKRYAGLKDFGNLIPGHGGILDRFDSIMFTAPVVYYYFSIVHVL